MNEQPVIKNIHTLFTDQKWTLGSAESCTGGLLAAALTSLPGSSIYYLGGISSYSNLIKEKYLGVSKTLLSRHGAVSAEVASAMATGAQKGIDTDFAISLTGIAGPTGGTPEKPVGTVWCTLAHRSDKLHAILFKLAGTRQEIREKATIQALEELLIFAQAFAK